MQVLVAEHVFPVASPPITGGAVAVDRGRIVRVGPRTEVAAAAGTGATVHDLGRSAILPGLVNAHTHLELSWMAGAELPRGDYSAWLGALLEARGRVDRARAEDAAVRAIASIVARGTVAVGDISNEGWIAPLAARSALHGVLFHEIYGHDAERGGAMVEEAAGLLDTLSRDPDVRAARDRLVLALTPHAPHTTSVPLLRALAGRAAASREPLSIHVAESEAEAALLLDGSGPLAALFRERGFLPPGWSSPGRSPVEHLKRVGVLGPATLAVHCVHLDQRDQASLQASRTTVVTCPRSNEALGVGTTPVPALLRAGIPVALGTDSLASAPDLDLFAEMASLRRIHPELAPAAVLRMATLNGARALGLDDRLGSIEAGKLADLIVVPLDEPLRQPLETICDGTPRVHRLQDALHSLEGPET